MIKKLHKIIPNTVGTKTRTRKCNKIIGTQIILCIKTKSSKVYK